MAYRDEREPLRSQRDELFARLGALETRDDPKAECERGQLVRELDAVLARLTELAAPRRLPLLSSIRIATPCPAKWESMVGGDRVRHCGICDREVWNLTALDPDEAEAFLAERCASAGSWPMRVCPRTDGYVQNGRCGPGSARLGRAIAATLVLGLAGGVAIDWSVSSSTSATAVPRETPAATVAGAASVRPVPRDGFDHDAFLGNARFVVPRDRESTSCPWDEPMADFDLVQPTRPVDHDAETPDPATPAGR